MAVLVATAEVAVVLSHMHGETVSTDVVPGRLMQRTSGFRFNQEDVLCATHTDTQLYCIVEPKMHSLVIVEQFCKWIDETSGFCVGTY